MISDTEFDADDLLAPIEAPGDGAAAIFATYRLARTSFCYLNPLPGLFVTITDWPNGDDLLFRLKGKRMISLLFPLRGDFILRDLNAEWTFGASHGGVVYRPRDSVYQVVRPRNVDILNVGFHMTEQAAGQDPYRQLIGLICRDTTGLFATHPSRGASFPISGELYWRLLTFVSDCRKDAGPGTIREAIAALEILDLLSRQLQREKAPATASITWDKRDQLLRCRSVIDGNFDKPLTVDLLAREAGMSRTKLNESFREAFGISPMTYLTDLRMHHAERLLRAGNARISQIAWAVGYAHPCNFAVAFKRHSGKSPKEFRRGAGDAD